MFHVITHDDGTDAWLIEGDEVSTFGLNASAGCVPEESGTGANSYGKLRPGCYGPTLTFGHRPSGVGTAAPPGVPASFTSL